MLFWLRRFCLSSAGSLLTWPFWGWYYGALGGWDEVLACLEEVTRERDACLRS
jgi:hypothetical protein